MNEGSKRADCCVVTHSPLTPNGPGSTSEQTNIGVMPLFMKTFRALHCIALPDSTVLINCVLIYH